MEQVFEYQPQNVCSALMRIHYDGDVVTDLEVIRGCHGNLQGIAALVKGMKFDDIIAKLQGIQCRGSRTRETSCPDQLAKALIALKAKQ